MYSCKLPIKIKKTNKTYVIKNAKNSAAAQGIIGLLNPFRVYPDIRSAVGMALAMSKQDLPGYSYLVR